MRYMFQLDNGHGRKKVICPKCHRKSLTLYKDESGTTLSNEVGRCDHESSCGYHYTPKDYFKDHPSDKPHHDNQSSEKVIRAKVRKDEKVNYLPDGEDMMRLSEDIPSVFSQFLKTLIPDDDFERVCHDYHLGGWDGTSFNVKTNDRTIFWQIDREGKVRSGKVIKYNPDGHRVKSVFVSWMHKAKEVKVPEGWSVSQCLFGEHLLSIYPDKVVVLVEAEKTAIIASALYPEYVWVATGGKSSDVVSKCHVLSGRNVIIYPDIDGHDKWLEYAEAIRKEVKDCKVIVSDVLKTHCTPDEVSRKIDIADWMIEELMNKNCIKIQ